MLNENIKKYRKEKGFSQETLAQELNVVRQTISKWEKGISVPDAEMLSKISEVLDVSVMTLLGGNEETVPEKTDNSEIANQLYILNNQFAKELYRRRKNRRIILIVLLVLFLILPFLCVFVFMAKPVKNAEEAYAVIEVKSEIFSEAEIDSAINYVVNVFENEFDGCHLREIGYSGDEIVKRESKYHEDSDIGDIILIKTVFRTDKHVGGGFNSDFTYDNWYFILERTASGHWTELDHGIL